MGTSTKSVLLLVLIVASLALAVVWSNGDFYGSLACGGVAIAVLAALLTLHFRRDLAPDYLGSVSPAYFNCNGLCFTIVPMVSGGTTILNVFFQNQYERPCAATIQLQPSRGFFLNRSAIAAINVEAACPLAGFGVVRIPLPVPLKLQGKRQNFVVGAYAKYPNGKGKRLRFCDGLFLRPNSRLSAVAQTAVVLAGAATGFIVLTRPASFQLLLPKDVSEELPEGFGPDTQVLWQLGDPPL